MSMFSSMSMSPGRSVTSPRSISVVGLGTSLGLTPTIWLPSTTTTAGDRTSPVSTSAQRSALSTITSLIAPPCSLCPRLRPSCQMRSADRLVSAHRGAVQLSGRRWIVRAGPVHDSGVVPDHHVTYGPLMPVDAFGRSGMSQEAVQQRLAGLPLHRDDVIRGGADHKGTAPRPVTPDERVLAVGLLAPTRQLLWGGVGVHQTL